MSAYERVGRFVVAKVAAFVAVVATLFVVFAVAPSVPVVGPLLLEYARAVATAAGFLVWVQVMRS